MAYNYNDLGLDQYLMTIQPSTSATTYMSNTSIDSTLEDGSLADAKISSVSADKIKTGTLEAGQSVYVGSNSLIFDGQARSIWVSDGTYKVVHIGKAVGFY